MKRGANTGSTGAGRYKTSNKILWHTQKQGESNWCKLP